MRWLLSVILLLACATACSSSDSHSNGNCAKSCTGVIHGAAYAIRIPKHWNGTLLVFSHGYRAANSPNRPSISNADGAGKGQDRVSQMLLAKGYALAGSSYAKQGWATADALKADNDLYHRFVSLKGKPKHTYAWGISLGGLVTELLDERADWLDGAVAFCGAVAGPLVNFDNWYRAAYAVKALLAPQLKLSGFATPGAALAEGQAAASAVQNAASNPGSDQAAAALYAAELTGMPDKTAQFATGMPAARADAAMQDLQLYLRLWYLIEPDLEQRFGGVPSAVASSVPALSTGGAALISALHGDVAALQGKLSSAGGVAADQQARAAASSSGNPTGRLRVPLLTLHGVYDPIALVANESVLRDQVAHAGKSALLQQSFIEPTGSFGYGHCGFLPKQIVGGITELDSWVKSGSRPTQHDIGDAVGAGLDPSYTPPAWPAGAP